MFGLGTHEGKQAVEISGTRRVANSQESTLKLKRIFDYAK